MLYAMQVASVVEEEQWRGREAGLMSTQLSYFLTASSELNMRCSIDN